MTRQNERLKKEERYAEHKDVEELPGAAREELYGGEPPMPDTYGGPGSERETPQAGTSVYSGVPPGEKHLDVPGKCPVCGGETKLVPTCKGCDDPVTRCKCR